MVYFKITHTSCIQGVFFKHEIIIIMIILIASIILFFINVFVCTSCPPGKYGASCNNTCTNVHCYCTEYSICDECEAGYWNISGNCKSSCTSLTCICTNYTNCVSCKDGSYGLGSKCDKNCSSRCDGNTCDNDGTWFTCKPNFTGNHCELCVDGMFGANCSLQCSRGCAGNVCNSLDGSCNCSKHYSGENCNSCIESRYGINCSKPCSPGCVQENCSSSNGMCDCKVYYKGNTCDVCVDGRHGDHCLSKYTSNVGAAVGGAVSAILVRVAGVVIVIILKRSYNLCFKKPRNKEQLSKERHIPQPVVYATVQKKKHIPVSAQQTETGHGYQAQQPHTSFNERHSETCYSSYEDISLGSDDSNTVQENVNQETR